MRIEADSVSAYLDALPDDRRAALTRLREVILEHLPDGFEETLLYHMPAYVVPHHIYPAGYHCNPSDPLPFINIASQKHFVAFYHMGLYADADLLAWFQAAYPRHVKTKLDMGKSCIRFKRLDQIPYELIGELVEKVSCDAWIRRYESAIKR
jgi:uncharacterized protein YdhG (YjbR/CyaY superfamily)